MGEYDLDDTPIDVGNFGDTPEHDACYPGAVEAWSLSLPNIKELVQA